MKPMTGHCRDRHIDDIAAIPLCVLVLRYDRFAKSLGTGYKFVVCASRSSRRVRGACVKPCVPFWNGLGHCCVHCCLFSDRAKCRDFQLFQCNHAVQTIFDCTDFGGLEAQSRPRVCIAIFCPCVVRIPHLVLRPDLASSVRFV